MPRKKKVAEPATGEAATATAEAAPANGPVSKMEGVRRALAEGVDSPTEGVAFVKARFGLEVTTAMFSAYKSQLKAKDGKKAGPKNKGGRPRKDASAAPAPASRSSASNGDALEAATAVKALVDRFGAGVVRGLADLFGK